LARPPPHGRRLRLVEEKERPARHAEDAVGAAIMPPKSPAQVSEHRSDRMPVDGCYLTGCASAQFTSN